MGGERFAGIVDVQQAGTGGAGQVFRGRQPAFDRDVAVKLLDGRCDDEQTSRRFRRECSVLGSLGGHPNIVPLLDAGVTGSGRPYLVMPFLARGTLWAEVQRCGRLPWQQVVPLGVKIAGALHTAHLAGLLHRDLKPGNILLSDVGEPLLADFAIAHPAASATVPATGAPVHAAPHAAPHAASYAAPELLASGAASVATDVYGLAATLWSALAGYAPYERRDGQPDAVPELLARIAGQAPPDLRLLGVPDTLARLLETALAREPGARPATAADLGRALQDIERAAGLPVTVLPVAAAAEAAVPAWTTSPEDAPTVLNPVAGAGAGPAGGHAVVRVTELGAAGPSRRTVIGSAVAGLLALGAGAGALTWKLTEPKSPVAKGGSVGASTSGTTPAAVPQASSPTVIEPRYVWRFQRTRVSWVQYLPGGRHLAMLENSTYLTVRTVTAGAENSLASVRMSSSSPVLRCALNPAGTLAALGTASGEVWVVTTQQQSRKLVVGTQSGLLADVQFSRDGRTVASSGSDGTVVLWNATAAGRGLQKVTGFSAVYGLAFHPDGRRLVACCSDSTVLVLDASSAAELSRFEVQPRSLLVVDISPDGRWLAGGSADGTVRIWEWGTTPSLRQTVAAHPQAVSQVAFSPDGTRVASIARDSPTVSVWDVATGAGVQRLVGATGPVRGITWSPDRKFLTGSGEDGVVRAWQIAT